MTTDASKTKFHKNVILIERYQLWLVRAIKKRVFAWTGLGQIYLPAQEIIYEYVCLGLVRSIIYLFSHLSTLQLFYCLVIVDIFW